MWPILFLLSLLTLTSCGGSPDDLVTQLKTRDEVELRELTDKLLLIDNDELIPALRRGLQSPKWRTRYMSAQLLGQVGASAAIPDLTTALDDTVDAVVAVAEVALGKLHATEAVPALIERLDHTADVVAARGAEALGRIGDPRALPDLCRRAPVGTLRQRALVLAALGPCVDDSLAPAWSDSARHLTYEALHHRSPQLRIAGIQSLRGFHYRGAADSLLALLHDPAPEVQHVVVQALGEITGPDHPAWEGRTPDMAGLVAALDSTAAASDNRAVRARATQAVQAIAAARRRRQVAPAP